MVEGNCDERGSAEYNLALGERPDRRHSATERMSTRRTGAASCCTSVLTLVGHDINLQRLASIFPERVGAQRGALWRGRACRIDQIRRPRDVALAHDVPKVYGLSAMLF
jgi:hypothetical protein